LKTNNKLLANNNAKNASLSTIIDLKQIKSDNLSSFVCVGVVQTGLDFVVDYLLGSSEGSLQL
jgi:hypothetical protein